MRHRSTMVIYGIFFINFTKELKQSTLLRLNQWFVFGRMLVHQYIKQSLLQPGSISFKHIILEYKIRNLAEQLFLETSIKSWRTKGNCKKAHWQTVRNAALLCVMRKYILREKNSKIFIEQRKGCAV